MKRNKRFTFIHKKGRIVYTHFGEGDYVETESVIRRLLAE